ncbi:MAG: MBL fold metallo-hydrolase [Chloroflexi bacterium]|nr:MAG: MBL fold metallo-hydrolase [Chloroflexota bacterium]
MIEQLGDLGLRPDDIDILICTHFDPDHAGYHDAFTKAELIVQREHYELARSGHPRFAAIRAHWDHPALRYRLIDGDTELLPGLTLLETGGHTPGMQSLCSAFSPLIVRPGRLMTTRSNCAPARGNCWMWSSASTWRWSSLAMMVSSGKR